MSPNSEKRAKDLCRAGLGILAAGFVGLACPSPSENAATSSASDTTTSLSAPAPQPGDPSEPTAIRILPVGDSITQADRDHDSYRRELFRNLDGAGFAVDFVGSLRTHHRGDPPSNDFDQDHEGHWGFRTDEILANFDVWLSDASPDIVLIHLGSNDVFQEESIDSTIVELEELITRVFDQNIDATVLLAQIIPTDMPSVNRAISDLNAAIAALVMRMRGSGSAVVLVDQHSGFDAKTMTYDGVHPNLEGERRMAGVWFDSLRDLLPQRNNERR